ALIGAAGTWCPMSARSRVVWRIALAMVCWWTPKRLARGLLWADQRSFRTVARGWWRGDRMRVPALADGRLAREAALGGGGLAWGGGGLAGLAAVRGVSLACSRFHSPGSWPVRVGWDSQAGARSAGAGRAGAAGGSGGVASRGCRV